jgi:magnesium-transporting ATPase (P-type)
VIIAFGVYFIVLGVLIVYLLIQMWPLSGQSGTATAASTPEITLFGNFIKFSPSNEVRYMLTVALAGALGSYVHAVTSFTSYVGNRRFKSSWSWWYILRPLIGMALALIFYFVIRGGLFSTNAEIDDVSPYGIAAVAGLVGMFSKQAADKLKDLFDSLFVSKEDERREDKLGPPQPPSA